MKKNGLFKLAFIFTALLFGSMSFAQDTLKLYMDGEANPGIWTSDNFGGAVLQVVTDNSLAFEGDDLLQLTGTFTDLFGNMVFNPLGWASGSEDLSGYDSIFYSVFLSGPASGNAYFNDGSANVMIPLTVSGAWVEYRMGMPDLTSQGFDQTSLNQFGIEMSDYDGAFDLRIDKIFVVNNYPGQAVASVDIVEDSITVTVLGTGGLNASLEPFNATDPTILWSSDNAGIASIDASGTVTGVAEGSIYVYATSQDDNAILDSAKINVTPALELDTILLETFGANGAVWSGDPALFPTYSSSAIMSGDNPHYFPDAGSSGYAMASGGMAIRMGNWSASDSVFVIQTSSKNIIDGKLSFGIFHNTGGWGTCALTNNFAEIEFSTDGMAWTTMDKNSLDAASDSWPCADDGLWAYVRLAETLPVAEDLYIRFTHTAPFNHPYYLDDIMIYGEEVDTSALLTDITVSVGSLSPVFDPATLTYMVNLPTGTTVTPTITPTLESANAVLTQTDAVDVTSPYLADRTTTIDITAENGISTETYTIVFNLEDDVTLSSILLSEGVLVPIFDPAVVDYAVLLPMGSTVTPTTTATTTHPGANEVITDATDITSGVQGDRTTLIDVTAEDGIATGQYTIVFNVSSSIDTNAYLSGLSVASGTLVPAFDSATFIYAVDDLAFGSVVAPVVSFVTSSNLLSDTIATIPSNVSSNNSADRTYTIQLIAEDGATSLTYTIVFDIDTIEATTVDITESEINLLVGEDSTLSVSYLPLNTSIQLVTWSSRNPALAYVTGNVVTASAGGSVYIIAEAVVGNAIDSCLVNIIIPVTNVFILEDSTSVEVAGTSTIEALVAPAAATINTVTWESTDVNVVTIDANGIITGVAVGVADIIVTTDEGGLTDTIRVGVYEETVGLNNETISFKIFPNPSVNNIITISTVENIQQVNIYSLSGSLINIHSSINNNEAVITLPNMVSGTYLIQLETDNTCLTQKLIIQ